MRAQIFFCTGLTALLVATSGVISAQPAQPPAVAQQNSAAAAPDYRPTIADLMVLGVQPRHTKIALAIRNQNWAYAAYETNELRGVLNRIVRAVPLIDRKYDTAAMIQSTITMPLQDLADAIKAKDAVRSTTAYAALTASCSACHQAVNHGVIVIKVPQNDTYPDQEFQPSSAPP
jgi:hypothetical protein